MGRFNRWAKGREANSLYLRGEREEGGRRSLVCNNRVPRRKIGKDEDPLSNESRGQSSKRGKAVSCCSINPGAPTQELIGISLKEYTVHYRGMRMYSCTV